MAVELLSASDCSYEWLRFCPGPDIFMSPYTAKVGAFATFNVFWNFAEGITFELVSSVIFDDPQVVSFVNLFGISNSAKPRCAATLSFGQ